MKKENLAKVLEEVKTSATWTSEVAAASGTFELFMKQVLALAKKVMQPVALINPTEEESLRGRFEDLAHMLNRVLNKEGPIIRDSLEQADNAANWADRTIRGLEQR